MNAAEFLVSVAASIGFLFGLGGRHLPYDIVAALLIGGVIAAPIAAWLVSRLATRWLGVAVGLVLILAGVAIASRPKRVSVPAPAPAPARA